MKPSTATRSSGAYVFERAQSRLGSSARLALLAVLLGLVALQAPAAGPPGIPARYAQLFTHDILRNGGGGSFFFFSRRRQINGGVVRPWGPKRGVAPDPGLAPEALTARAEKAFSQSRFKEAALGFQQACAGGSNLGCANLGRMYRRGLGGLAEDAKSAVALFRRACDAGDASGCNRLGISYEIGEGGLAPDLKMAVALYQRACDKERTAGCGNLGDSYLTGKGGLAANVKLGVEIHRKACAAGDAVACDALGNDYELGNGGLATDVKMANRLYRKACDGGDTGGCADLGVNYEMGRGGLTPDLKHAIELYGWACERGYGYGCGNLGIAVEFGKGGLVADPRAAVQLYRKACNWHDSGSCYRLGFAYETARGGLAADPKKAVELYRLACDWGAPEGCANLAVKYGNAQGGLAADPKLAVTFYRKGCAGGHAGSCNSLGVLYSQGKLGLTADARTANQFFRKACDSGDAKGCFNLGLSYEDGDGGLPTDPTVAAQLYRKACDRGFSRGCNILAIFYQRGKGGLAPDLRTAVQLYRKACDLGNALGCANLGMSYERAEGGLPSDPKMAVQLYRKACDNGDGEGCYQLGTAYEHARGGLAPNSKRSAALYRKACDAGYQPGCENKSKWNRFVARAERRSGSDFAMPPRSALAATLLTYFWLPVPAAPPDNWQSIHGPGFVLHLPKGWQKINPPGDQRSVFQFAASPDRDSQNIVIQMGGDDWYDLTDISVRRQLETRFRDAILATLPRSGVQVRYSLTSSIFDLPRHRLWYRLIVEGPPGDAARLGLFVFVSTTKGIIRIEGRGVAGDEAFEDRFQVIVNSFELESSLSFQKPYLWFLHIGDYLSSKSVLPLYKKFFLLGTSAFLLLFALACFAVIAFIGFDWLLFHKRFKRVMIHNLLKIKAGHFAKEVEGPSTKASLRRFPLPWSLSLQIVLGPVIGFLVAPRYLHNPQVYGPFLLALIYLVGWGLLALALACHYLPSGSRRLKYELVASAMSVLAVPGTLGDPMVHAGIVGKNISYIHGAFTGLYCSQTFWFIVGGLVFYPVLRTGKGAARRASALYRLSYSLKKCLMGMIGWVPVFLIGGGLGFGFVILVCLYEVGQRTLENPILYLRSYHDQNTSVVLAKIVMPTAGRFAPILATAHTILQPPEELYRRTNLLAGSRLAVLPEDAWRNWILSALRHCRAVLIDISVESEGIHWELEQVRAVLAPTKFAVLARSEAILPNADFDGVTVIRYRLGWRDRRKARKALRGWLKSLPR